MKESTGMGRVARHSPVRVCVCVFACVVVVLLLLLHYVHVPVVVLLQCGSRVLLRPIPLKKLYRHSKHPDISNNNNYIRTKRSVSVIQHRITETVH